MEVDQFEGILSKYCSDKEQVTYLTEIRQIFMALVTCTVYLQRQLGSPLKSAMENGPDPASHIPDAVSHALEVGHAVLGQLSPPSKEQNAIATAKAIICQPIFGEVKKSLRMLCKDAQLLPLMNARYALKDLSTNEVLEEATPAETL